MNFPDSAVIDPLRLRRQSLSPVPHEVNGQLEGVNQSEEAQIANTLANLGRDGVEPPLA